MNQTIFRRLRRILFASLALALAACSSGGGGSGDSPLPAPVPTPAPSTTPEIVGAIPSIAPIGMEYQFTPEVKNLSGTLSFSVGNQPAWAQFDSQTGTLSGTPAAANEGDYPNVVISVSNGTTSLSLTSVTILVRFLPDIHASLTRSSLHQSETTTLTWDVSHASKLTIDPGFGEVSLTGTQDIAPTETTTYKLTAVGEGGQAAKELVVTLLPALVTGLSANVTRGSAPLDVLFAPVLQTQNAANRYYWDFEGDGGSIGVDGGPAAGAQGFDRIWDVVLRRYADYDVVGRGYGYTFTKPGTYNTRLRVVDANGVQRETSVAIEVLNAPPQVTVNTDRNNGEIPLAVNFLANATDNEGIATLDWDFDGDGVYDFSSAGKSATHAYTDIGTFQAKLRVRDTLGAETVITLPHIEIRARPQGSPAVKITTAPSHGNAPLDVALHGAATLPASSSVTQWQWDFDGDGTVDDSSGPDVTFRYTAGGNYYPKLHITTQDGKNADTAAEVVVTANHQLIITNSTIDPENAALAKISTMLGGRGPITLVIESRNNNVVRNLVPWTDRDSGSYDDAWNGRDDAGNVLPPGDYYAVLKYRVAGDERVLDLRATSGGKVFFPTDRTVNGGSCVGDLSNCGSLIVPPTPLAPFAQQPWIFQFSMPQVADVTAYMSVYTTNSIVSSFFQGRAMGVGNYEIMWNGEGTDGRLLPTVQTKYLISVVGRTLADNAIFLDHGARLSKLNLSPSILYPNAAPDSGTTVSSIHFDLSRKADITMTVSDVETGGEVYRRTYTALDAGANLALTWAGTNNDGVPLAPGAYLISLEAQRADGSRSLPVKMMQRIEY